MNALLQHLVVLPILVPMLCAALMLFLPEGRRVARVSLALLSTFIQLSIAIALLYLTSDAAHFIWPEGVGVYTIGNWNAPFGSPILSRSTTRCATRCWPVASGCGRSSA